MIALGNSMIVDCVGLVLETLWSCTDAVLDEVYGHAPVPHSLPPFDDDKRRMMRYKTAATRKIRCRQELENDTGTAPFSTILCGMCRVALMESPIHENQNGWLGLAVSDGGGRTSRCPRCGVVVIEWS